MGSSVFMPTVRSGAVAATITLSFLLTPFPRFSLAQRAIDTYAITNARIMPVKGPPIERGTVVVRNGLIAAVGPNITVPADARLIDGTGLTVYPGLIDACTSLGIPEPSPSPSPSPGMGAFAQVQVRQPGASTGVPNSSQPIGLQPELRAEDLIRATAPDIEAARNAGITVALIAPRSGIWVGQSALIALAGETPQQMIVRSPVAMHVGFTPLRGGVYPGSLMGVIASLRQMLLDAQRYREALQIYERSPRGIRRPDIDKSLAALIPVLDGRMPVVIYADRDREILRALELTEEFKLRSMIAGGRESWKLSERLRLRDIPVLLSLNLPRRTTTAMPEADPEPIRILRERVEAPQTAGKLASAKVRFAFQSGALTNISDFLVNARRAVENGLGRDDALRALTLWPAEIFGVANQLGSIETGKIANLTVMRGDLFDRNSQVSHVFIDGRPIDRRAPMPTADGRMNIGGTWALTVDLGKGDMAASLTLLQEGEQLRGSLQGSLGSAEIANGSLSASGDVRFTVPVTVEGQTMDAIFTGTVIENEMRGTVTIEGRSPGSFTATRAPG
jgi:imidazolonepropionase-like amidohydrolase